MKFLLTSLALVMASVTAFAQKTPVVITVDVQKVYASYTKAQDAEAKFRSSLDNARTQEEDMKNELGALREEIQGMMQKSESDAVTPEAAAKLKEDIEVRTQVFNEKNNQLRTFLQDTGKFLNDRLQAIRQLHLNEIREAAREIGSANGADLVLNSSGMNAVLYASDAYDITQKCIDKLNAAPAATPAK